MLPIAPEQAHQPEIIDAFVSPKESSAADHSPEPDHSPLLHFNLQPEPERREAPETMKMQTEYTAEPVKPSPLLAPTLESSPFIPPPERSLISRIFFCCTERK